MMKKKFNFNMEAWIKKRTTWFLIIVTILLQAIFFFFISLNNVYTETYDLDRFTTANTTIRSPISIENEQETERKTREAVQQVEDRYSISEQVNNEAIGHAEEIFDAISTINAEEKADKNADSDETAEDADESAPSSKPLTNEEKIERLRQILSEEIVQEVNSDVILTLLNTSESEVAKAKSLFIEA
ncbi:hypothetical protein JYK21_06040, partial [Ralstonia pickettii]|nr:hypothetical protein [Ralstonia pickettii]